MAPVRKKVSMMSPNAALFDSMTVEQNVAFPSSRPARAIRNEIKRRAGGSAGGGRPGRPWHEVGELELVRRHRRKRARALPGPSSAIRSASCTDEPNGQPVTRLVSDVSDRLILTAWLKRFNVTSLVVTHDMKNMFKYRQPHRHAEAWRHSFSARRMSCAIALTMFKTSSRAGPACVPSN